MELYILDNLLRRTAVVDRFQSLIWTERYSSAGDFELNLFSTEESRALFVEGQKLATNNSLRVMTVETIEDKDDSDGRSLLNVKGPSIEDVLSGRTVATPTGDKQSTWSLEDTPGNIARRIFADACVNNSVQPLDNLPFYTPGSLYSVDSIAEPFASIKYEITDGSAYDKIKEICEVYGLGFRLYRGLDTSKLYFNVYTGSDRTTGQASLPSIVFSPNLDTMSEVSELRSISGYKNVAYVFASNASQVVYLPGYENVSGFDRRVLYVDVSGETQLLPGTALNDFLYRRGIEELSKNRSVRAIDGEVPQSTKFIYGIDYNLGDLVEMRNAHGVKQNMRVTEHIAVSDESGDRSYPTLATETVIIPGSWYGVDYNLVWDDADGTWDDA